LDIYDGMPKLVVISLEGTHDEGRQSTGLSWVGKKSEERATISSDGHKNIPV
jgi:hypothetical protein